jgi:hypothetical protein
MAVIRLVAGVALGLFVAWLVQLWTALFSNVYIAAAIWIPACLGITAIYDRLGLFRPTSQEMTSPDQSQPPAR